MEERVQSTVPLAQRGNVEHVDSSIDRERAAAFAMLPGSPPPGEVGGSDVADPGPGGRSPIPGADRESNERPPTPFERAQVWHDTYRVVRKWVAASPSAQEVSVSIEPPDVTGAPAVGPAMMGAGIPSAPAAVESRLAESSEVPELHLSIGTISVVVEERADEPAAPRPTPPARPEPAVASDWTRLRRLYLR
jgi:hypothetical protein